MKIITILGFVVLLVPVIVFGANDSKISEFGESLDVGPPLLPGQDESIPTVNFLLNDNGRSVSNVHVIVELSNQDTGQIVNSLHFSQSGDFDLKLSAGRWVGTLGIDEASTLGSDFFSNVDLKVSGDRDYTPLLVSVGSIQGEVYDENGRVVTGASIKVQCQQYIVGEVESDDYGVFLAEYIHPGECKISALHNNDVGDTTVEIKGGTVTNADVTLDKQTSQGNVGFLIGAGLVILMFGLLYFGVLNKGKLKGTKPAVEQLESSKEITPEVKKVFTNQRIDDVLKTLQGREKAVVTFLLENNTKSTQAKILYGTNIPKTSLMRIFDALAARNILDIQKEGKAKKIKLTNWLLGKEENQPKYPHKTSLFFSQNSFLQWVCVPEQDPILNK